jgi:hypothetical protein
VSSKCFQLYYTCSDRLLTISLPSYSFHFISPLTVTFPKLSVILWSRVSSGSIVSDYGLDDRAIGVRFPAGAKDFSSVSRPALGPTQPSVQWVPGVLSPGV